MIKRSGQNVSANEVESVIEEHPSVYEAAVIGIPDKIRDEGMKAYVVLRKNHELLKEELMHYCRLRLAKFKVPDVIEIIDELPRTSFGAVEKYALQQMHAEEYRELF
ncbi:AMP-binding enzyme [Peribacillus asahii]|nr:hypothetical protein [Peribacillus asahii]